MAHHSEVVLGIVKARLNRLASDTSLDEQLKLRIQAIDEELESKGITLVAESVADSEFLADYTVWEYGNRDKTGGMPEWLKLKRRERWLTQQRV